MTLFKKYSLLLLIPFFIMGCNLSDDEDVLFFPTYGVLNEDETHWEVPVHAWIYTLNEDGILLNIAVSALTRAADIQDDDDPQERDAQNDLVRDRVQLFTANSREGKRAFVLKFGEEEFSIAGSTDNGHLYDTIQIPVDVADTLLSADGVVNRWLSFEMAADDGRLFKGRVQLIPHEGLSVISDVDDTIKVTNVAVSNSEALRHLFWEEYQATPGFQNLYQGFLINENASFHYLTAQPWQLYPTLQEFIENAYPQGSAFMQTFPLNPFDSSFWDFFDEDDVQSFKIQQLRNLFDTFPQRRFVLAGDTGQRDPEVYGAIVQSYGDRIEHVFLRNTTREKIGDPRFEEAFGTFSNFELVNP